LEATLSIIDLLLNARNGRTFNASSGAVQNTCYSFNFNQIAMVQFWYRYYGASRAMAAQHFGVSMCDKS